ncbi:MAG: helix-turn-helix domain-containing protein [Deltaproteobacteria bacterium]|nr:helix-turn-helix domain-containing protein [Deltaproteobacteria bacterium]
MPAPPSDEFAAALAVAKNASWAQVLFKCARLLNERALALLQKRTKQHVRPSHTALFPHIDLQGTRPGVLAERVGISKQAVGQLVEELVEMGLLEQVADPADGRARLVMFSARGKKGLLMGLAMLGELEAQLGNVIGTADAKHMHATLLRLLAALEETSVP